MWLYPPNKIEELANTMKDVFGDEGWLDAPPLVAQAMHRATENIRIIHLLFQNNVTSEADP
jgi:hypothetical protein